MGWHGSCARCAPGKAKQGLRRRGQDPRPLGLSGPATAARPNGAAGQPHEAHARNCTHAGSLQTLISR
jgi:hypothetical protein